MKQRFDFVTNSSSTSYIIYLPENFDPISKIKEKDPSFLSDLNEQEILVLEEIVKKAKKEDTIYLDDYDYCQKFSDADCYDVFCLFETMVRNLDLIVGGIDTGPDDIKTFVNIASDKVQKSISKIKENYEK